MINNRPKSRRIRNKNGCVCCRVRRSKCDGERPICGTCKKHGVICLWPTIDSTAKATISLPANDRNHRSGASISGSTSTDVQSNVKAAHQALTKLNVEKISKTLLSDADTSDALHAYTGIWNWRGIPPLKCAPGNGGSADTIFQHYVQHIAPKLIASSHYCDSFLSCVLPLAVSEPVLMSTLLAISSSHITHRTRDFRDQEIARQCYASATSGLRKDLVVYTKTSTTSLDKLLYLLAATLTLYQYEVSYLH